jgi:hypothetical protein
MVTGEEGYVTPGGDCYYEVTIDLKKFLKQPFAQDYVANYLEPNDYKAEIEYVTFGNDTVWSGYATLIHEFELIDSGTHVADATAELQAAIDGLKYSQQYYQARLNELATLVTQWDISQGIYTTESYAALQAALAEARAVVDAGEPDHEPVKADIVSISIDDPNWEVQKPDFSGYVSKDAQVDEFGVEYVQFVAHTGFLRASFRTAANGIYTDFSNVLRYNRSDDALPVDFKMDKIHIKVRSGGYWGEPMTDPRGFKATFHFKDGIEELVVPWMVTGQEGYVTPGDDCYYEVTIDLAEFLNQPFAQDYVTNYLEPNDYKAEIEYVTFGNDTVWNGYATLIHEFELIDNNTHVADALAELQAAIDGLETVKETTLHDGAKIRTSGAQGLMFGTMVDSAIKNAYIASGYTPTVYGTVLLPADMIPAGGELTKETAKAVYKEFTANEYPNLSEYSVYLIGWTEESQMTREITARSYVVYQKGEEQIAVYSSNTVTRSVYTVAINIYNEESGNPPLEDNLENGRTAYNWLISGGA